MPLSDVVGHEEPLRRLIEAAGAGRLAHAYLFQGPSGVGKRAAARALFAALACPERGGRDSCGACSACLRIAAGEHPDFHELGPDERGVLKIDPIRDLQHRLAFQPFEAKVKFAVVDEAHRMNPAAANAFLKTLEEPPRATVIVLVSQAPSALMPTILSRVQRVAFRAPAPEEVEKLLAREPDLPEEDRRVLALHAEGSYGRALGEGRERILKERPGILRAVLEASPSDPERATLLAEALGADRAKMDGFARWTRSLLRDVAMVQAGEEGRVRNLDALAAIRRAAERADPRRVRSAFDRVGEIAAAQEVNVNRRLAMEVLLRELLFLGEG